MCIYIYIYIYDALDLYEILSIILGASIFLRYLSMEVNVFYLKSEHLQIFFIKHFLLKLKLKI